MSLFKRQARRVAAVGVGVGLLVLGLEAPAFAVPTVSGVSPNNGPADCVVVITGTGFLDFQQAQQTLSFVGPAAGVADDAPVPAADWARISATEIWAEVPTGAIGVGVQAGTTYTVTLTDPTGGTSTGTFLATTGAGGCAPTITEFAPACGPAGTVVVLTGTNLIGLGLVGGEVAFSPYAAAQVADHTKPDVDEPTSLSVIVPTGTVDGRIRVTTGVDTDPNTAGIQGAFSATNFEVPPPDCPLPGAGHTRSTSLSLRKHLVARGRVSSTEDPAFTDCVASVPVKIQRRRGGAWRTVGKTTTTDTGAYKKRIKDRPGKYRALAPKVTVNDEVCLRARSAVRRHRH